MTAITGTLVEEDNFLINDGLVVGGWWLVVGWFVGWSMVGQWLVGQWIVVLKRYGSKRQKQEAYYNEEAGQSVLRIVAIKELRSLTKVVGSRKCKVQQPQGN